MFSVLWQNGSSPLSLTLKAQLLEHPSNILTSESPKVIGHGFKVSGVNAQDGDYALECLDKTRLAEHKSQPSGHEKAEDRKSRATELLYFARFTALICIASLINS